MVSFHKGGGGLAKKCVVDGVKFASLSEGRRYKQLKLLVRGGHIRDLVCHPRFEFEINGKTLKTINVNPLNGKTLKRKITFTADFAYLEEGAAPPGHPLVPGKIALVPGLVVEDVKPWRRGRPITTRDYMLKKALMFVCHGIEVIEVQA
jgi:hypothetical protein